MTTSTSVWPWLSLPPDAPRSSSGHSSDQVASTMHCVAMLSSAQSRLRHPNAPDRPTRTAPTIEPAGA